LSEDNKSPYSLEANLFKDYALMLSGFIHDINNPIAVITGQISILQTLIKMGKSDEERVLKVCSKVENSTNKLGVMIDEMRSFYKPHQSSDKNAEIGSAFKSVLFLSSTKIYRNEISFSNNELEAEVLIGIEPKDLSIILWNLINFVLDLAKIEEMSFDLKIEKIDKFVQISFNINKELITKELLEGQISVLVASKLVKAASGTLSIKSATCFTISLPIISS
jgi:C4-dicarboxylate-specific signal transduction histidine kinase